MFDKLKALIFSSKETETETETAPGASFGSTFEGANYSPRRNRVPGSGPVDLGVELNASTRSDLVAASRYVVKNTGFGREQVGAMSLYAVGTGLRLRPQAGSRATRKRNLDYFKDWSKKAELSGRFSLEECERMVCRLLDEDGEAFVYKTRDDFNVPKIQIIETHRIGPWGEASETVDGLAFDNFGRVRFYRFKDDEGVIHDLPGDTVLHVFAPERPSVVRAAPSLSHATNHVRDEMELLALEKHAVKDNADVTRVLQTDMEDTGEGSDFNALGDAAEGEDKTPTDVAQLQRITGGKTVTIKPWESLESFESNRPNPTFTGFLTHLRRDSSGGLLPYEFTEKPGDVNGAGVRLIVARADRKFSERQNLLINRMIEGIWLYVIGDAIETKQLRNSPDWWRIKVGAPRRVTVDAGRETKENREDVMKGLKNLGDHFEELGKEFEDEVEQRAQEVSFIKEMAEKYDIPVELLFAGMIPKKPKDAASPTKVDQKPKTK